MKIEIKNIHFGTDSSITIERGLMCRVMCAIARLFGR